MIQTGKGETMERARYKLDNENSILIEYDGHSIKVTPVTLNVYNDYRGMHYKFVEGNTNKFNELASAKKFLHESIKAYKFYQDMIKQTEAFKDFV